MKSKASHQNRFLRIITVPIRALCKARDLYVKSMINYADRMNCGNVMAVPASQYNGLPKSFSANSTRSNYNDEDFRELVRAASARSTCNSVDSGSGPRAMPPRSSSVAMGRIDEDMPCCYFGEDINSSARNELNYPRSKSHAVITPRRLNAF